MAVRKTVTAGDGRTWEVTRKIDRSPPAVGDNFEHDVDGGRGAVVMVVCALIVFGIVIVAWPILSRSQVHVPVGYWFLALVILGFFPVRWYLRRPWTIVAETEGHYAADAGAERWVGNIRGISRAQEEMRVVVLSLRQRGTPGHADSPLQPVS
jgi:hypothetical protein